MADKQASLSHCQGLRNQDSLQNRMFAGLQIGAGRQQIAIRAFSAHSGKIVSPEAIVSYCETLQRISVPAIIAGFGNSRRYAAVS